MTTHLVEGWICAMFFIGHSFILHERDCFVFGLTCMAWTLMWFGAYVAMDYDNMAVELKKINHVRKRIGQKMGRRVNQIRDNAKMMIRRRPSDSDFETSANELELESESDRDRSLTPVRQRRSRQRDRKPKRS